MRFITVLCALMIPCREIPGEEGEGIRFSERLIAGGYSYAYGIAAGDLDGDGDLDLTSADCKPHDCLYWFDNDGKGNFRRRFIQKDDPFRLERHRLADIDGDGDLDLVVVKNLEGQLLWFENSGRPTDGELWGRHVLTTELPGAYDVAVADIDGDGDLDVAASSWILGNQFAWFENDGTPGEGTWSKHLVEADVDETRAVHAVDIDGDGDIDIMGTAAGRPKDTNGDGEPDPVIGRVLWYENGGGDDTIRWMRHVVDEAPRPMHGGPVDMDGDGDLDIVMALGMSLLRETPRTHQVIWYENDGETAAGHWKKHVIAPKFSDAIEAVAGDLDGDGDIDVVATSWRNPGRVAWFENGGDPRGRWTMHLLKDDWRSANQVLIVDLDGDGRLDLAAVAEHGSNELRWWRNEGPAAAALDREGPKARGVTKKQRPR